MSNRPDIPLAAPAAEPRTCQDAEPFALRVTDASMAPEFPEGCVVIVDPTGRPAHGAFVVAEDQGGLMLRRLDLEVGGPVLRALDGNCPDWAPRAGLAAIRGVVTQRAGRRRRDRRRY